MGRGAGAYLAPLLRYGAAGRRESLRDTAARVLPYYIREILPRVLRGEHVLVAAHGNSLRALVMVLDKHTPETITKLNLDTGVPMIYRLNADSTVTSKLDLAA